MSEIFAERIKKLAAPFIKERGFSFKAKAKCVDDIARNGKVVKLCLKRACGSVVPLARMARQNENLHWISCFFIVSF